MVLGLLLAAGGCSGRDNARDVAGRGASPPTAAPVQQSNDSTARVPTLDAPRVLIIGTSLTAGLGLDPEAAYPAHLQRLADSAGRPALIVGAGLSGETSAGALRRAEWLLREPASIVILETGANDGLRGLDPDSTAANVRALVRVVHARAPRATIIIAQMESPRNLGASYTRRFHELFGAVAKETGSVLMPFLLEGVAGVTALNQDDGIHPNERGARRVAENVWKTLGPLLVRPEVGR